MEKIVQPFWPSQYLTVPQIPWYRPVSCDSECGQASFPVLCPSQHPASHWLMKLAAELLSSSKCAKSIWTFSFRTPPCRVLVLGIIGNKGPIMGNPLNKLWQRSSLEGYAAMKMILQKDIPWHEKCWRGKLQKSVKSMIHFHKHGYASGWTSEVLSPSGEITGGSISSFLAILFLTFLQSTCTYFLPN